MEQSRIELVQPDDVTATTIPDMTESLFNISAMIGIEENVQPTEAMIYTISALNNAQKTNSMVTNPSEAVDYITNVYKEVDFIPTSNNVDTADLVQLEYVTKQKKTAQLNERAKIRRIGGLPSAKALAHLKDREGFRDKSYSDSLGKLTGGTGHLLSKEEQKLYPKGSKIPEHVTSAWLIKDSAKATKAAIQQAADIGQGENDNFIDALTSVNFQLGTSWHTKFPSAYKALKEGRYDDAKEEILYTKKGSSTPSNWAKQTPTRVEDFKQAIEELKGK